MIRASLLIVSLVMVLVASTGVHGEAFTLPEDYHPWPDQSKWVQSAEAKGYDEATAHAPDFTDKAIWPYTTGKEAYATQQWPRGRVYVWAHPGESTNSKHAPDKSLAKHDLLDPNSWLEDGKTPAEVIFDDRTDIVLPTAEKPYVVHTGDLGKAQYIRHVTVGRNAQLGGGGDGQGRQFFGNVWIKRGGSTYAQSRTVFGGDRSTFVRNDNTYDMNVHRKAGYQRISQYIGIHKADGASVEVLGLVDVLDEFGVESMLIIGPDSRCHPGRLATPVIGRTGTLALMDGAFFGSWTNNFGNVDLKLEGTLQGGLPDRPLTRNAYVGVHFKNHTSAEYTGPDAPQKHGKVLQTAPVPSIAAASGSTIRSYSSDPAKARLVITAYGDVGFSDLPADPEKMPAALLLNRTLQKEQHGQLAARMPGRYAWYETLPRGIELQAAPGVTVDTVAFDHVRQGGLVVPDSDRQNWKHVHFGPNCFGEPATLHAAPDIAPALKQ